MTSISAVAQAAAKLAGTFSGQLLKPADRGYEEARKVHNGLVDKRPALIARCCGVADVADAVNLTRTLGLEAPFAVADITWPVARPSMAD